MIKEDALDSKTQKNLEILHALIALGGKSDRAIAKILGISNSALSKRKRMLEQEGYIKEYTIIPDFHKMGLGVIVFTFSSTADSISPQQAEEARELIQKYPEILCALDTQDDMGTKWVTISIHKNYDSYLESCKKIQKECTSLPHRPPRVKTHSFLIPTGKQYLKPFLLRGFGSSLFLPKKPYFPHTEVDEVTR